MATEQNYPTITCDNPIIGGATHEIHIFLLPVNPEQDMLDRYFKAVDEWNENQHPLEQEHLKSTQMKACHLSLEFLKKGVDGKTDRAFENVRVMQSARYVYENDPEKVIAAARRDEKWFNDHGISVVRVKIEASAYGNKGIPQTDEEAQITPDCYFEFHVKVIGEEATPDNLRHIADQYSSFYGVPVPFSHNLNPNQFLADAQGNQLYFNMRFRLTGLEKAKAAIKDLEKSIGETHGIKLHKVISEYVWFDTYVALDKGWIE